MLFLPSVLYFPFGVFLAEKLTKVAYLDSKRLVPSQQRLAILQYLATFSYSIFADFFA